MPASTAGYSGTPLARKLGIVEGSRIYARDPPRDYRKWLAPLPPNVMFENQASTTTDIVHIFSDRRAALESELVRMRAAMGESAAIWVSWPKRASKVPTDITEDTVRALALPIGLVDVKVCAISEVWSGLKLVIRKELRRSSTAEQRRR
jgi:hypothetical protein